MKILSGSEDIAIIVTNEEISLSSDCKAVFCHFDRDKWVIEESAVEQNCSPHGASGTGLKN